MVDRTATGRLRRLLALVPYVLVHQGSPLKEVAATFEISEKELIDDLDLLWVCGLPGYSHLELIDVSYDSGDLYIRNADVISTPMRLHRDEAMALLIGLQLVEPLVDTADAEAFGRLRGKIHEAASDALAPERIAVVPDTDNPVGVAVAEALGRQRRLLIDYFVPSRDEVTQREIDPVAVTTIDGQRYLKAWCRQAEGFRHFRIDRIQVAKIVDRPASPPASSDDDLDRAFTPAADAVWAEIKVHHSARWLIDYLSADLLATEGEWLSLRIAVGDEDRIVSLALQLGGQMELLTPELRQRAWERSQSALAAYH